MSKETMTDERFQNLLASTKEAVAISQGKAKAARASGTIFVLASAK